MMGGNCGPVPVGCDWMLDRFDTRKTNELQLGRSWLPWVIERYVDGVAEIGRENRRGDRKLRTPIGDCLPADLYPLHAAELADQLAPALARAHELLRLLDRRAGEPAQIQRS